MAFGCKSKDMKSLQILYCVLFFCAVVSAQEGGTLYDSCNTVEMELGICISIMDCPSLLELLNDKPISDETLKYLRSSHCGFDKLIPKVCCPINDLGNVASS